MSLLTLYQNQKHELECSKYDITTVNELGLRGSGQIRTVFELNAELQEH